MDVGGKKRVGVGGKTRVETRVEMRGMMKRRWGENEGTKNERVNCVVVSVQSVECECTPIVCMVVTSIHPSF